MRVLIVEDEADLARTVKKALEEYGFAADIAPDGEEGLFSAREIPYDAIVLDLMLPRLDGWQALSALRAGGTRTPVLVLTARDATGDKVRALDLGADDYLTKPFVLAELAARLRALIRRSSVDPSPTVVIGDTTIDTGARTVRVGGELVSLTAKEYAVLEFLVSRRGTLVTRTMLCDHLYSEDQDVLSNVLDVYVASLRRKLGRHVIQTRHGLGYIIG